MRRTVIGLSAVVAITATILTGCSGVSGEAVDAASAYAKKLAAWSAELDDAVTSARTATPSEWDAGDGEISFEEVGLGATLDDVPELAGVHGFEGTAAYLMASEVADRVAVAVTELKELEPEAFTANNDAESAAYDFVATLYFESLDLDDARAAKVFAAFDADEAERPAIRRAAWEEFLAARATLLDPAIEAAASLPEGGTHVASVAEFMVDWLTEEKEFNEAAAAKLGEFTVLDTAFDTVWNYSNLNTVLEAPMANAAALRTGYVALIGQLADALGSGSAKLPDLPAPGDPYRQVLLDGFVPLSDSTLGSPYAADRLWMLWHIRELEGTPDDVYLAARYTLQEELARATSGSARGDFRPAEPRLTELLEEYDEAFDAWPVDDAALARIAEVEDYAAELGRQPMIPAVQAAFDGVIAAYGAFDDELSTIMEDYPDEYERIDLLEAYAVMAGKDVREAIAPVEKLFGDDAAFQAAEAAVIDATAPSAWKYGGLKASAAPTAIPEPSATPER